MPPKVLKAKRQKLERPVQLPSKQQGYQLPSQKRYRVRHDGSIEEITLAPEIENIVFEGGGVLGAAYWKVLKVLKEHNIKYKRLGGSSAGACMAMMCALDYESDEIEKEGRELNFKKLLDRDTGWIEDVRKRNAGKSYAEVQEQLMKEALTNEVVRTESLIKNHGHRLLYQLRNLIHKQVKAKLEAYLQDPNLSPEAKKDFIEFLKKEGIASSVSHDDKVELPTCRDYTGFATDDVPAQATGITFNHLHLLAQRDPRLGFKDLYVTGSNITEDRLDVFSHEKHPNMEIALAVRISMSIPGVFHTVNYNGSEYNDGGLRSNFPMHIFNLTSKDDKRYISPSAVWYQGEKNQNMATLGFKTDTRLERRNLWYKYKKKKRGVFGKIKHKLRKEVIKLLAHYDYSKSEKREFKRIKEQFANRTIVVPAYDTTIDQVQDLRDKLRKQYEETKAPELIDTLQAFENQFISLESRNTKIFDSTNFKISDKNTSLLADNGEVATEDYLAAHDPSEVLEQKTYDAKNDSPDKNFSEALKQLSLTKLREIYYSFKSKDISTDSIYCGLQGAERLRKNHFQAIKDEVSRRYKETLLNELNELREFQHYLKAYFPSASQLMGAAIPNQNTLKEEMDPKKLKELRDQYQPIKPELQKKYQIFLETHQSAIKIPHTEPADGHFFNANFEKAKTAQLSSGSSKARRYSEQSDKEPAPSVPVRFRKK